MVKIENNKKLIITLTILVVVFILSTSILMIKSVRSPTGAVVKEIGDENTLNKVINKKELDVCYINFPPTIIKDPKKGELSGHFIDTVELIANEMGIEINYHESTWTTFIIGLNSGQCDLSIAPTFKTINRAKSVAFTKTLFYVGNSAIIKKGDERFKTLDDLKQKGIKIAVTQGEAGHEYAKAHLPYANLIVHTSADQSEAFNEVSAGRADIALGDAYATKVYAEKHPEVVDLFADKPYNLLPVAWAVRQGDNEWLQFIDTAIDSLESSGKLIEFEKKYDANWYHK